MNLRLLTVMVCMGMGGMAAYGQAAGAVAAAPPAGVVLSEAKVYPLEGMLVRKMANGGESRDVLRGVLLTGEAVAAHESVQPVGAAPSPLHRIDHSEIVTVIEGTVAFEHDGKSEQVGPGGVIFVAVGTVHALKNVGSVPAKYLVVQIGGDTKK